MTSQSRAQRLRDEHDALAALRTSSTILEFQAHGDPPERYELTFRGRSPCRALPGRRVEWGAVQRVELRLPFAYPESPPDVRWRTPLLHPNVSPSGFLSLRELGIVWGPAVTLDALCERLWDVARLAYVNTHEVLDYEALRWLEDLKSEPLPVDPRPLRDIIPPANPNIIQYQVLGGGVSLEHDAPPLDVLYIGEDTPTPRLPAQRTSQDIFYIGDE